MWEMLTRKQPYGGRNFMGVSLEVLEGKRPQIPNNCPEEFQKLMTKCWNAKPDQRPSMETVLEVLEEIINDSSTTEVESSLV